MAGGPAGNQRGHPGGVVVSHSYEIRDRETGKLLIRCGSIERAIRFLEKRKPVDCEILTVDPRTGQAVNVDPKRTENE